MSEYNPFAAPTNYGDVTGGTGRWRDYGGIGRLAYFGCSFLANLVYQGLQKVGRDERSPTLLLAAIAVLVIATVAIGFQRCRNMGANGWWALGLFVPILNIVVGIKCIACPAGYQDHKTLDGPGRVLIGLLVGAIFLVAIMVIFIMLERP